MDEHGTSDPMSNQLRRLGPHVPRYELGPPLQVDTLIQDSGGHPCSNMFFHQPIQEVVMFQGELLVFRCPSPRVCLQGQSSSDRQEYNTRRSSSWARSKSNNWTNSIEFYKRLNLCLPDPFGILKKKSKKTITKCNQKNKSNHKSTKRAKKGNPRMQPEKQ